ncbi:MAG: hypothetical protein ACK5SX_04250 [Sandaracinobacter sp.]
MIEAIFWSQKDFEPANEADLIRKAYAAIKAGPIRELEPATNADAKALDSAVEGLAVELIHPDYSPANGYENSTIALASGYEPANKRYLIHMGIHLEDREDPVAAGWRAGLRLAPAIAQSFEVELGFMNGSNADDDRQPYPSEKSLRRAEIPALTAWTFIGSARLDRKKREILEAIGAPHCLPLGEGWQIRLVENLFDEPDPELLDRLEALEAGGLAYFGPRK